MSFGYFTNNQWRIEDQSPQVIPVDLDGLPGNERILILLDYPGMKTVMILQVYDTANALWANTYEWTVPGLAGTEVEQGFWRLLGEKALLLKTWVGSGSFLSYRVLAYKDKTIRLVEKEDDIFQGSVWFEQGDLIQGSGNQFKIWSRRGNKFFLTQYQLPQIPGALVIKYKITPDKKVQTLHSEITIPVGGIIQLIRTDRNAVSERVLYSYSKGMEFIPHRSAIKFNQPTKTDVTIIPDGYDWNSAKIINISVTGN